MADDEPLDDARQVAVAAAAAASRVVETVAREAADYRSRQRATLERAQDQERAQQALRGAADRLGVQRPTAGYDSTEQRQQRDVGRMAAGVPAEARQVRATADLMNGKDPAGAAAAQSVGHAAGHKPPVVTRQQDVTRSK